MRWAMVLCGMGALGCGTPDETPTQTGWQTDFEACVEIRHTAEPVPVHLLLTVDSSGSMDDGEPVSKWAATTEAFRSFFQALDQDEFEVALALWPEGRCNGDDCDADACSQPQVPPGDPADPAHQASLLDALTGRTPEGGTPLSAALDGAVRWAVATSAAQETTGGNEPVAIVLVTDGEPNGCDESIDNIAALAEQAATSGVRVFVVGIEGSNEAQVDQIAAAGGTGAGYFVGASAVETELLAALDDIRDQVLPCSWVFPEGEALDPDRVRVEATVEGQTAVLARVGAEADCADGGWYLEGEQITLCPSTCTDLQGVEISLEIAVGCQCEVDSDCAESEICDQNACVPCGGQGEPACPGELGRGEVVQGGALICGTAPLSAGWLLVAGGLFAIRRRSRWS